MATVATRREKKTCLSKTDKNHLDSDRPSHGRRYHQLRPPGGPVRRFRVSLQFFNNNLFVAATTPRLSLTWPPILLNITRLHDGLKRPSLPYRSMKLVRMPAGSGVSQPTPSNTSPAGTMDLEKRKSQTEERWIFPHATNFSQEVPVARKDTYDLLAYPASSQHVSGS